MNDRIGEIHSDCSLFVVYWRNPYTTPSLKEKEGLQCPYTVILKGTMAENDKRDDPTGGDSAHDNKDDDKKNTGDKPQEFLKRLS